MIEATDYIPIYRHFNTIVYYQPSIYPVRLVNPNTLISPHSSLVVQVVSLCTLYLEKAYLVYLATVSQSLFYGQDPNSGGAYLALPRKAYQEEKIIHKMWITLTSAAAYEDTSTRDRPTWMLASQPHALLGDQPPRPDGQTRTGKYAHTGSGGWTRCRRTSQSHCGS